VEPEVLGAEDAGEMLTLQRAAYVTEAQAHADPFLPPLTQSLAELEAELERPGVVALGVREAGRLVASVRVRVVGDVAEIGRLAVAPDRQGQGLGTALLGAVEARVGTSVRTLRLYTGEFSAGNLRLYGRLGYVETHREPSGGHSIVFMEKHVGLAGSGTAHQGERGTLGAPGPGGPGGV
jgi:GNAT superfamily N-acetyltransferase